MSGTKRESCRAIWGRRFPASPKTPRQQIISETYLQFGLFLNPNFWYGFICGIKRIHRVITYFYDSLLLWCFWIFFKHKGSSQHSLSKELKLVGLYSSKLHILCSMEERKNWKQERTKLPFYILLFCHPVYGTFAKVLPSFHCVFALSLYRVKNHLFCLIA